MEFVGNRLNRKTILATLIVAFFIGRVHMAGGSFCPSIALITVMVSVSTLYIYLVPVLWLAMLTFVPLELVKYSDLVAMLCCALIFILLCDRSLSINRRSALAGMTTLGLRLFVEILSGGISVIPWISVLAEVLLVIVLIRVFNGVARSVFTGTREPETVEISMYIFLALILAGADSSYVAGAGLTIISLLLVRHKNVATALSFTATASIVFTLALQNWDWSFVLTLLCGLLAGKYLAYIFRPRYRYFLTVAVVAIAFTAVLVAAPARLTMIAGVAGAAVLLCLPPSFADKFYNRMYILLFPSKYKPATSALDCVKKELLERKKAYEALSRLYGCPDGRQVLSFQFEGMARVTDELIRLVSGNLDSMEKPSQELPIHTGSASYAQSNISGDCQMALSYGKNLALIISDGMGKGSRASGESTMVVNTLARLLSAGFDVDLAVKTINGVLLTRKDEDLFATLDLAIIDKKNGKVKIFKMGAASTFIKHGKSVEMIKKPALPAGIVPGLKLTYQETKLRRGDMIVMVSDGVCDCDRDDPGCRWLVSRLQNIGSRDADTVAELIVNKAVEKYQLRERDDLTVLVAIV